MTHLRRRRMATLTLLFLGMGCDSNPEGPRVPPIPPQPAAQGPVPSAPAGKRPANPREITNPD